MSEKPRHNPNGMMRRLGDYSPKSIVEIHPIGGRQGNNGVEMVKIREIRPDSVLLWDDGRSLSPETAVLPRWPVQKRAQDGKLGEEEKRGFYT